MTTRAKLFNTIHAMPYYTYVIGPCIIFLTWNANYLASAHQFRALTWELARDIGLIIFVLWIARQPYAFSEAQAQEGRKLKRLAINAIVVLSFLSALSSFEVYWRIPPEIAQHYQHHRIASGPNISNSTLEHQTQPLP
jgi:hypothetical protein